jgi:hypothetical protein
LADSLALRRFVGIALDEYTPDHSTISRTRRLIALDTHREVFGWVLGVLADRGLLKGQRIASMRRRWRRTRRCVRLCGATRGRATRSFRGDWRRPRDGDADAGAVGAAGPEAQEAHVERRMEESLGRRCADCEDERRAHAPGAQGRARGGSGHGGRSWQLLFRKRTRATPRRWMRR